MYINTIICENLISPFWIYLFSIINGLILFVLALATLRAVIRNFFPIIPRDRKWSWIVYNQYDKELLLNVFRKLGFTEDTVIKGLRRAESESRFTSPPLPSYYDKELIELVSKYIYYSKKPLTFGKNSIVKTHYYINTMEASHNNEHSKLMCEIIGSQVIKEIGHLPDFIICPKAGNPLLGRRFAHTYQIISIFGKSSEEKSLANIDEFDYKNRLLINIEGSNYLIKKAEENVHKQLEGILIDCNTSSGTQIIDVMNNYNEIIKNIRTDSGEKINIEPIKKAFVFFVIVDEESKIDIDNNFEKKDYNLYRGYDLTEELKKQIYNFIDKNKELKYYTRKGKIFIDEFIRKSKDLNCYKFN